MSSPVAPQQAPSHGASLPARRQGDANTASLHTDEEMLESVLHRSSEPTGPCAPRHTLTRVGTPRPSMP
jgi:hypothetical protein